MKEVAHTGIDRARAQCDRSGTAAVDADGVSIASATVASDGAFVPEVHEESASDDLAEVGPASTHASHVFVTRGDLLHFACDAWLLPGDLRGEVTPAWRIEDAVDRVRRSMTEQFRNGDHLAVQLAPTRGGEEGARRPS